MSRAETSGSFLRCAPRLVRQATWLVPRIASAAYLVARAQWGCKY